MGILPGEAKDLGAIRSAIHQITQEDDSVVSVQLQFAKQLLKFMSAAVDVAHGDNAAFHGPPPRARRVLTSTIENADAMQKRGTVAGAGFFSSRMLRRHPIVTRQSIMVGFARHRDGGIHIPPMKATPTKRTSAEATIGEVNQAKARKASARTCGQTLQENAPTPTIERDP